MRKKLLSQRPILTLPQILVFLSILAALIIAIDLNRREQSSQRVGVGAAALEAEVAAETTRQIELQATLSYVQSDDYVASYARSEAGYLLPGERRVVPLPIDATPAPVAPPTPTPEPALNARPWQAWWQLLSDTPLPRR